MKILQCGQPGCRNSVSCPDQMSDADVEKVAEKNGWTKQEDGTWKGCSAPQSCPMVQPEPTEEA